MKLAILIALLLLQSPPERKQQAVWEVKARTEDGALLLRPKPELWLKVRPRIGQTVPVQNGDFMVCRHVIAMDTDTLPESVAAVDRPALDCGQIYYIERFVLVTK